MRCGNCSSQIIKEQVDQVTCTLLCRLRQTHNHALSDECCCAYTEASFYVRLTSNDTSALTSSTSKSLGDITGDVMLSVVAVFVHIGCI